MNDLCEVIFFGAIYCAILWLAADIEGGIVFPSIGFSVIVCIIFLLTNVGLELILVYIIVAFVLPLCMIGEKRKYVQEKEQEEYRQRKEEERKKKEYIAKVGEEQYIAEQRAKYCKDYDELADLVYNRLIKTGASKEFAEYRRKNVIKWHEDKYDYYKYKGEASCKDESNETKN